MDINVFWHLIEQIDREWLEIGNEENALQPLKTELKQHSSKNIEMFHGHLVSALYAIDSPIQMQKAGDYAQSDDSFLYARCFIVACGRETYESALAHPDTLETLLDDEQTAEALLYVAEEVWLSKNHGPHSKWTYETELSYETGSNLLLWSQFDNSQAAKPEKAAFSETEFATACSNAGHAFKNKMHQDVIRFLLPYKYILSSKQQKMLSLSINQSQLENQPTSA